MTFHSVTITYNQMSTRPSTQQQTLASLARKTPSSSDKGVVKPAAISQNRAEGMPQPGCFLQKKKQDDAAAARYISLMTRLGMIRGYYPASL
jgi:hypothetical protein